MTMFHQIAQIKVTVKTSINTFLISFVKLINKKYLKKNLIKKYESR